MAKSKAHMPATLKAFEEVFLDSYDQLSVEEISLIVRVYTSARSGSVLFYSELERAVVSVADNLTNAALVDILTALTLARDFISQQVFRKLASTVEKRLRSFSSTQLIQVTRLYEFNQVDIFPLKREFLELTRIGGRKKDLRAEDLLLSLELLNLMGERADSVVSRLDALVEAKGSEKLERLPCTSTMTMLSVLADPATQYQLKPATVTKLATAIENQVATYNHNQVGNLIQALVRFDEEWDTGHLKSDHLAPFYGVFEKISHHLMAAGPNLLEEERLFAANFYSKLCQPRWQKIGLRLATRRYSETAN